MNLRTMIVVTFLLASAAGLQVASAQLATIQPCGNSMVHTFQSAGGMDRFMVHEGRAAAMSAQDTCSLLTGNSEDFDHDYDAGIGGGLFYASDTCGPAPGTSSAPQSPGYSWSPHHSFAPGSAYEVAVPIGVVAYAAGVDGPLGGLQPLDPCLGDGVISDLDPWDCGGGASGVTAIAYKFASIEPTRSFDLSNPDGDGDGTPFEPGQDEVARNSSCDPVDGYVAVFIFADPIIVSDSFAADAGNGQGGDNFLSTPLWGTITDASGIPRLKAPHGHITIHKWPGGMPTVLAVPTGGWICNATVGDVLTNPGSVTCAYGIAAACVAVQALGYAAAQGSGGAASVTSSCATGGPSATATFPSPGGTDTKSATGVGTATWTCAVSFPNSDLDDIWTHCDINQ